MFPCVLHVWRSFRKRKKDAKRTTVDRARACACTYMWLCAQTLDMATATVTITSTNPEVAGNVSVYVALATTPCWCVHGGTACAQRVAHTCAPLRWATVHHCFR